MIRVLVLIAVAGFLVSVVTLSSALAIGGPDLFTDGVWNVSDGHWGWTFDDDDHGHRDRDSGAEAKREMAWTGGDALAIEAPAEVTYTQAPGPGKLIVIGPQRAVEDLVIEDGHLRFAHGHRHHSDELTITMTAPGVNRFNIDGSGRLAIENYKQDKLSLDISGDAEVSVKGEAKTLGLDVSGSGLTDLSGLKLTDANVSLEGSGQATIAPTGSANLNISGSGQITLLSHPSRMESNVSGSGSIHQRDADIAPPSPPEPPKAPKPPHPPRTPV